MNMRSVCFPRRLSAWVLSVAMVAVVCAADAAVLYTQPPIDGGNAHFAETITPQQVADDFTLGSAVNLEGITWWGSYFQDDDQGDDFLVRLYSGMAGTGTILQDFGSVTFARTSTALTDLIGDSVYQYDFSLAAPLSLSAGTYYLSIQNINNNSYWLWLTGTSGNGQFWSRGEDTDPWAAQSVQEDLAFALNGTQAAPEPGTLVLLLLAGAALLVARRRG